jgi:histidine triad (HIT) family protein
MTPQKECLFCQIVSGNVKANIVFVDDLSLAFLDHRPLFHGHCLLIPREHVGTLGELPNELLPQYFLNVQRISASIEKVMRAEGTFVAINNKVSQSVPHLHVHIVPRTKGDGLKGFFWPRKKYESEQEMEEVAARLRKDLLS